MSGYFEGKKIAWRQTAKDGIVLALSIHPDDMPKEMAGSSLNTRYMMAFVEIGAKEPTKEDCEALLEVAKLAATPQAPEGGGSTKKWSDYTRSQQAHILTKDPVFWAYFGAANAINCDGKLKLHLRITSKSDLDKPENHKRWDEFVAIYNMKRPK